MFFPFKNISKKIGNCSNNFRILVIQKKITSQFITPMFLELEERRTNSIRNAVCVNQYSTPAIHWRYSESG